MVEARLRENRRLLGAAAADPFEGIIDVRASWSKLGLDRRQAILGRVIDRVIVHPTEKRGPKFDTDRIELVFRV